MCYKLLFISVLLINGVICKCWAKASCHHDWVKQQIHLIPIEDQRILTLFFKRLFYRGDFLYVLMGAKPMGSIDYNLRLITSPLMNKRYKQLMVLDRKGWKVWNKYQHLFPMKNYCFIAAEGPTQEPCFTFFLINKPKCLLLICKNLNLFQSLIQKKATPKKILHLLCKGSLLSNYSFGSLKYHQAQGILFGYDADSIYNFTKKIQLEQDIIRLPINYHLFPKQILQDLKYKIRESNLPSDAIESFPSLEKLIFLKNSLRLIKATKINNPLFPLQTPSFISDNKSKKTDAVIANYDGLRKKLMEIYYSENFLGNLLEKLTL